MTNTELIVEIYFIVDQNIGLVEKSLLSGLEKKVKKENSHVRNFAKIYLNGKQKKIQVKLTFRCVDVLPGTAVVVISSNILGYVKTISQKKMVNENPTESFPF